MSQDDLLAEVKQINPALRGLNQSGLSKRLRGVIPFDIEWLEAIATVFDIDVTDLFPRSDHGVRTSGWISDDILGIEVAA